MEFAINSDLGWIIHSAWAFWCISHICPVINIEFGTLSYFIEFDIYFGASFKWKGFVSYFVVTDVVLILFIPFSVYLSKPNVGESLLFKCRFKLHLTAIGFRYSRAECHKGMFGFIIGFRTLVFLWWLTKERCTSWGTACYFIRWKRIAESTDIILSLVFLCTFIACF